MPRLTWLVTGCSSGFGDQFVHAIVARGDRVIATARNATGRLQPAKDIGAAILDLDITAPQAVLDAKVKEAIGIYGTLDVLVNNAGYIEGSLVEEARYGGLARRNFSRSSFADVVMLYSYDRLVAQFNTNLFGTMAMTRAVLPHFREKKAGVIAFLGSDAGWIGEPGAGPYCGTKFALEGQFVGSWILYIEPSDSMRCSYRYGRVSPARDFSVWGPECYIRTRPIPNESHVLSEHQNSSSTYC